jgi:putative aldouronate transport system permease protein
VTGIVLTVFHSAMCAFALRKRDLPFRGIFLGIFTIPLFFGGGIIPDYMIYRAYGILDTFWVYILPRIVSFFYVIILIAYFRSLGDELEESAHLDGAGFFTIFIRIYLPLCLPVLAVIALFTGVYHWQSWFETVYFTRSDYLRTLSVILLRLIRSAEVIGSRSEEIQTADDSYTLVKMNPEGVKIATMFVTIAPILLIYPFLQRYFVKGLMIGSLKG